MAVHLNRPGTDRWRSVLLTSDISFESDGSHQKYRYTSCSQEEEAGGKDAELGRRVEGRMARLASKSRKHLETSTLTRSIKLVSPEILYFLNLAFPCTSPHVMHPGRRTYACI